MHNPRYEDAKLMVELKTKEIEDYAAEWRTASASQRQGPTLRPGELAPLTLDQLKYREAEYQKIANKLMEEALDLGRKMLYIEKLKREITDADSELGDIERRLTQLRMEQGPAERIDVPPAGDRPLMTKDSRAAYASAGAIGGMGLGFAIMMLFGLLDRSFRSPDDARTTTRMPLLGILPNLPENLADPEQASIAAHCVHQIRTLLQLGGRDRRIFAITSPAAGTGKTSLTLSLGVSFAASNCRTLIIDCDLIGGGLTARVDTIARRKIGDILLRHKMIDPQQLQAALKLAETSGKRVGEVLIELGYVKQSDIDQALHLQYHDPVGMLEAIDGENILDCVAETGIERLAILPLGAAMPADVSKLSPAIIRSILDQARKHFDVVLIDTGPVPGSLEASVAAAAADGVVLVVSRGEHRPMAERSIQHLLDIGAQLAGMVFNRAEGRDMAFATTTKRLSSFDRRGMPSVSRKHQQGAEGEGFGPMALAVATKAPSNNNGTRPRS
jgi:Mrp family chromosome partitioning ATPase